MSADDCPSFAPLLSEAQLNAQCKCPASLFSPHRVRKCFLLKTADKAGMRATSLKQMVKSRPTSATITSTSEPEIFPKEIETFLQTEECTSIGGDCDNTLQSSSSSSSSSSSPSPCCSPKRSIASEELLLAMIEDADILIDDAAPYLDNEDSFCSSSLEDKEKAFTKLSHIYHQCSQICVILKRCPDKRAIAYFLKVKNLVGSLEEMKSFDQWRDLNTKCTLPVTNGDVGAETSAVFTADAGASTDDCGPAPQTVFDSVASLTIDVEKSGQEQEQ